MKFTTPAGAWQDAVGRVSFVLPAKETASPLDLIRVTALEGRVELSATDGTRRVDLSVPAQAAAPGQAYAPGKLLAAQAATLEGEVRAEVVGSDLVTEDGRGRHAARLADVTPGAFPAADEGGNERLGFLAPGAVLGALLRQAAPAAGVCHVPGGGYVEGVTVDVIPEGDGYDLALLGVSSARAVFARHRLAAAHMPPPGPGLPPERFLAALPLPAAKLAQAFCKDHPDEVRASFSAGRLRLEAPGAAYTMTLLADARGFPWRGNELFLPTRGQASAEAQAEEFALAVGRACASLEGDESRAVTIALGHDKISASAAGRRGRGEASCPASGHSGKDGHAFRVNGDFLTQHLLRLGEGLVKVVAAKNVLVSRDNVAVVLAPLEADR